MTIKQSVLAALEPVLANTWAIELPKRPEFPAIVFDIDTQEEKGWVLGGGYDQHVVSVVLLAKDLDEIDGDLRAQVIAAMQAIPGFMGLEEEGDAEYEGDAAVYAYALNFRIRTAK